MALANLRSGRRDSHTEIVILNFHDLCSLEYSVRVAAHDDQEGHGSARSGHVICDEHHTGLNKVCHRNRARRCVHSRLCTMLMQRLAVVIFLALHCESRQEGDGRSIYDHKSRR